MSVVLAEYQRARLKKGRNHLARKLDARCNFGLLEFKVEGYVSLFGDELVVGGPHKASVHLDATILKAGFRRSNDRKRHMV
jgi:hypothetical protein